MRHPEPVSAPPTVSAPAGDALGRPLRSLRISVTDRCNMRCAYCMPRSRFGPGHRFLDAGERLDAGEIQRLARLFLEIGVDALRITGGEPLLRRDIVDIVARLAALPVRDLALTTNGALLRRHARALAGAGLHRVTVSLDSLDPSTFRRMSDSRVEVSTVLDGIAAAQEAGMSPVKVNCVVRRGLNDGDVPALASWARDRGVVLRFIEYMDVGSSNGWRRDEVVGGDEILAALETVQPLRRLPGSAGDVAARYEYADGGEIGLITSVTRPFCGDCSRARIGADGRLFTCLFASVGTDLRAPLRSGASDDDLRRVIRSVWGRRDDRYSELRGAVTPAARVEMSYIGG